MIARVALAPRRPEALVALLGAEVADPQDHPVAVPVLHERGDELLHVDHAVVVVPRREDVGPQRSRCRRWPRRRGRGWPPRRRGSTGRRSRATCPTSRVMSTTRRPSAPRSSSSLAVASSSRRRVRCARAPITRPSEASAGSVTAVDATPSPEVSDDPSGSVDRPRGRGARRPASAAAAPTSAGSKRRPSSTARAPVPAVHHADLAARHLERPAGDVAVGAAEPHDERRHVGRVHRVEARLGLAPSSRANASSVIRLRADGAMVLASDAVATELGGGVDA